MLYRDSILNKSMMLIYRKVNTRANIWKRWYILADTQKNGGVDNMILSGDMVLIYKKVNTRADI